MKTFVMGMVLTVVGAAKDAFEIDFEALDVGSTVTRLQVVGDHYTEFIDLCSVSYASAKRDTVRFKATAMVSESAKGTCLGGFFDFWKHQDPGKTLILSGDLNSAHPKENEFGGYFLFMFPKHVQDISFEAIGFEEGGVAVAELKNGKVKKRVIPKSKHKERHSISLHGIGGVVSLKIITLGPGAIDDLSFSIDYDVQAKCKDCKDKKSPPVVVPPVRDERSIKGLSLFLQGKNLRTTSSATLPDLETATQVYDAILDSSDLEALRDIVLANTREGGLLVELTTKLLDVGRLNLPPITDFAMYPPVNQTSLCSLLEIFELYLNTFILNINVDDIASVIGNEIKLLDDIVAAFPREFDECLKDWVSTFDETEGRYIYNTDTFLYRENFPGVLDGPFVSQFWSLPYLLQQSHQALPAEIFIEETRPGLSGTFQSYLKTQTAARFERLISGRVANPGEFSHQATAVHSDALMAFSVKQLDMLLTSNLHRYECSEFIGDNGILNTLQADFVTCSGCLAFYKQFYSGVQYALLGAFAFKKKFNRIRPEQFAYLIARATEKPGEQSCLNIALDECTASGVLTAETCRFAEQGEPFTPDHFADLVPFFAHVLQAPSVAAFLDAIKARQDGCLLLNMLYPEGGPPHDAFPGGHSVYAGAVASLLGGMFCMYEDDRVCTFPFDESQGEPKLKSWGDVRFYNTGVNGEPNGVTGLSTDDLITLLRPIGGSYQGNLAAGDVKEFTWKPTPDGFVSAPEDGITVWSELVKLASQYTHARDRSGVHYYTDGCSGMLLGELMTIRYLISNLQIRPSAILNNEEETIVKPLFDGRHVVITAKGVRLWGSTDPPSLDVNFLIETSPFGCSTPVGPIRLDEALPDGLPEIFTQVYIDEFGDPAAAPTKVDKDEM